MTAAVIMSLVEEGRIGLLQAVRDYLPELPATVGEGVLVHHLLTHTAGFDAPLWTGKYRRRFLEKADDDAQRQSRLLLCDLTARTLKTGLSLLGINVVEKM